MNDATKLMSDMEARLLAIVAEQQAENKRIADELEQMKAKG